MRFTERLRRVAEPIWQGYFTHPFVTGIGDGSLSVEKFRFFLLQDYLYLYDYAKVFCPWAAEIRHSRRNAFFLRQCWTPF